MYHWGIITCFRPLKFSDYAPDGIVPSKKFELSQKPYRTIQSIFWCTRHRKVVYHGPIQRNCTILLNENLFRNVRNEKMTRIKNENAPIPPPRKSLNSSRENTPKKKKHQTSHVKEFTIENFVNQVLLF